MTPSARLALALVAAALALPACASQLLDQMTEPPDDAAVPAPDLALPPTVDGGAPADLAGGGCVPPTDDGGTAGCPCGAAGLCRAASGRLVVQTATPGGNLHLVVMDDNGCHRRDISADLPLAGARWAADHERLAYVTAAGNDSILHVLRVAADNTVACHAKENLGSRLQISDVAWAAPDALWLFSRTLGKVVRHRIGMGGGNSDEQTIKRANRFDAVGDGPLVVVEGSTLMWSPLVVAAMPTDVFATGTPSVGNEANPRLSSTGEYVTFEEGSAIAWAATNGMIAGMPAGPIFISTTAPGHQPAFAMNDDAIVFAVDVIDMTGASTSQLWIQHTRGPQGGTIDVIPSSWFYVYTPDWTGLPAACTPSGGCPL